MAEENTNQEITQMCQALCDYFRYVSSSGEMIVTIKDELFYTKRYLECVNYPSPKGNGLVTAQSY